MTSTFEPGCTTFGSLAACTPGGVSIRGHADCEACGRLGERVVEQHPNSPFWGVTYLGECGALVNDGFEFNDETKPERRETFEQRWQDALPEGTRTIIDNDTVWLAGVVLPNGTRIMRGDEQ